MTLEEALRFYAKHEHWMGITSDDTNCKLLIANGDTKGTDGWCVAEAALGKADTVARQSKQDGVPDQGSVRNATDRLTNEEIIAAWNGATSTSPLESNDLLRVYVHYMRAVADAQLKKAIRALPDQKD